ASLSLSDKVRDRSAEAIEEPDGTLHADGVLPGTYHVNVECPGYQARDHYPAVEVKDKDVTQLVWEVDAGATLRGKVVTKTGAPVEGASIWARTVGGALRGKTDWNDDKSTKDGSYELAGLRAGSYK